MLFFIFKLLRALQPKTAVEKHEKELILKELKRLGLASKEIEEAERELKRLHEREVYAKKYRQDSKLAHSNMMHLHVDLMWAQNELEVWRSGGNPVQESKIAAHREQRLREEFSSWWKNLEYGAQYKEDWFDRLADCRKEINSVLWAEFGQHPFDGSKRKKPKREKAKAPKRQQAKQKQETLELQPDDPFC